MFSFSHIFNYPHFSPFTYVYLSSFFPHSMFSLFPSNFPHQHFSLRLQYLSLCLFITILTLHSPLSTFPHTSEHIDSALIEICCHHKFVLLKQNCTERSRRIPLASGGANTLEGSEIVKSDVGRL